MLAMAVILSSYERRSMSLLHNRDAPIAYLLSGLGQPVADGGKLVIKGTVRTYMATRMIVSTMLAIATTSSMMVGIGMY